MRLLAHLSKKSDAEIQKKMEELGEQPGAAAKKAGTAANKKSGILDQFVDVAGKALGPAASALLKTPAFRTAISKMAAPVAAAAAAAFGAPALAPVLLKVAPAIVSGMVAAATSGGSSTKSGAATSTKSGAATSDAALSEKDKELKLMEIQRLQNHQSEMFRMVSQILAVNHQTRLAVIGNVR